MRWGRGRRPGPRTRATDRLTQDDTTVSAVAWHVGVAWHTLWDAVETEAAAPWPLGEGTNVLNCRRASANARPCVTAIN
jgi:hypothetical protein